jgi:hypothetical protein
MADIGGVIKEVLCSEELFSFPAVSHSRWFRADADSSRAGCAAESAITNSPVTVSLLAARPRRDRSPRLDERAGRPWPAPAALSSRRTDLYSAGGECPSVAKPLARGKKPKSHKSKKAVKSAKSSKTKRTPLPKTNQQGRGLTTD